MTYLIQGIETSLVGATHAQAVSALRNTGDQVTLIVLSAGSVPPVAKTAPLYSSKCTILKYCLFHKGCLHGRKIAALLSLCQIFLCTWRFRYESRRCAEDIIGRS